MVLAACRGDSAAAHGSFTQFTGQLFSYGVHGVQHLIKGDQLPDTGQSQFCCDHGISHPGGIAHLAGIFHQAAHRVAYQSKHIHKHSAGGVETLNGGSAKEFHRS